MPQIIPQNIARFQLIIINAYFGKIQRDRLYPVQIVFGHKMTMKLGTLRHILNVVNRRRYKRARKKIVQL